MADSDYEEEEILLYVNFSGTVNNELLKKDNPFIKVVGLDTEQPLVQIEEQVFAGEYKDALGTALFFEETMPKPKDPVFCNKTNTKQLSYVCKSNKVLNLSRVFLKEVKKNGTDSGERSTKDIAESSKSSKQ